MEEQEILKDLYDKLSEEKVEVLAKLNMNLSRINEIDQYVKSLSEKEDSDLKVFSPRNADAFYKENIDKNNSEKRLLEIENRNYYKRINQLDRYLESLSILMQGDKESNCPADDNNGLRILDIQEKDRQRIARDLHDSSLQNLAHLVHKIELSSMFIDQDPLRAKLELATVTKNLRAVIDEIRNTIFDMRPMTFDDLGLKDCIERLLINLKQANPTFDFSSDLDELVSDNDLVLMNIYRVVQECCSNAIKHSGGDNVFVSLKTDTENCVIKVKDNGTGFLVEESKGKEKHFGLSIIEERIKLIGGISKIDSGKEGTEVSIVIPLNRIAG